MKTFALNANSPLVWFGDCWVVLVGRSNRRNVPWSTHPNPNGMWTLTIATMTFEVSAFGAAGVAQGVVARYAS